MTLKLKRTPGLYLVGFMGSGKSTIGAALADELGWSFADIDADIEGRLGKSIASIFRDLGEERFRELESEELARKVAQIQAGHPYVIATGGGAFAEVRNWNIVENNGVTVWLHCDLGTVHRRLGAADPTRPLSADRDSMRELFDLRQPLYARADFHVDANCDSPAQVTREILGLPIF